MTTSSSGPLVPLQRPPRLHVGDAVAVVATSSPLEPDRLAKGVRLLESWGLEVQVGSHATDRNPTFPHLAGIDADRANDLERAWCDQQVRAVFVGRGGTGAARLIDLLDWQRMRSADPKVLVGFSDVTTLHQAVANRLGLASLFGPMPATQAFAGDEPDTVGIEHLRQTLFQPDAVRELAADDATCVVPGRAEGVTVGGTVALLAAAAGTSEWRPADAGIAVLEDVAEPAYRLDTHLTQLLRAGWFAGVRGIVLGSWTDCADGAVEVVSARLGSLGVPLFAGLPFGHCTPAFTVPLGVPARADADRGTLTFSAGALR